MRDMTKCRGRRPLPKMPDTDMTFRDINEEDLDLIFRGSIRNGALFIESEIHAGYDSEKVYTLSRRETRRLFSLLTVEEFTKLCREEGALGMTQYFEDHGIRYESCLIW